VDERTRKTHWGKIQPGSSKDAAADGALSGICHSGPLDKHSKA
jgi:hypothetical protein